MPRKHIRSIRSSSETHSRKGHRPRRRNLTWLLAGLGVLLVVVVGLLLLNSNAAPSVEISPAQAYARLQQGAFFLDVRSQDEWNQFHIKGSTLIPLNELQSRLSEVPKEKDIVVVCLSGHRSLSGTSILQQAGYSHVSCLSGGLQAWMDANYPLEQSAP